MLPRGPNRVISLGRKFGIGNENPKSGAFSVPLKEVADARLNTESFDYLYRHVHKLVYSSLLRFDSVRVRIFGTPSTRVLRGTPTGVRSTRSTPVEVLPH